VQHAASSFSIPLKRHLIYALHIANETREIIQSVLQLLLSTRVPTSLTILPHLFSINSGCSESVVFLVGWKRLGGSFDEFVLHSTDLVSVDLDVLGSEDWGLDENEVGVVHESSEEPDEWLLELVVGLGGDVVVLEILLSVEGNLLGLDLSVLDVDLVSDENDGDGLADAGEIFVPLGDVGVCDTGAGVEHDDSALSADVVAISEATELLLTGSVPDIELALPVVCEELHWVDLDTEGGDVFLLEFTSEMALDEGGLADSTVSDEDEFELWDLLLLCCVNHLKK